MLRRILCALGRHSYGDVVIERPTPNTCGRIYCRCIYCSGTSAGWLVN